MSNEVMSYTKRLISQDDLLTTQMYVDTDLVHTGKPYHSWVSMHEEKGLIKSCCLLTKLNLESAVFSAGLRNGIEGVLSYLAGKFKWGLCQESYLCDCFTKCDKLACGSFNSICMKAIEIYQNFKLAKLITNDESLSVYPVQLILNTSPERSQQWTRAADPDKSRDGWINSNCVYHECIGLVNSKSELVVWDLGKFILPPAEIYMEEAVISLKVNTTEIQPSKFLNKKVKWGGLDISFNNWINVADIQHIKSNKIAKAIDTLSRIYRPRNEVGSRPTIYISGCYMGSNPAPGVGIARSIKMSSALVNLIAVGDEENTGEGICDPIFDGIVPLNTTIKREKSNGKHASSDYFVDVLGLLRENKQSIFLPGRCEEVEYFADQIASHSTSQLDTNAYPDEVLHRILCPPKKALVYTEKPNILSSSTGTLRSLFRIPETFLLNEKTGSLYEAKVFAERVGYPIMVKGLQKGCTLCSSWAQVASAIHLIQGICFLQRPVNGVCKGIAFASFDGKLLGSVMMTKDSATCEGKVSCGTLSSIDEDLMIAIGEFANHTQWSGGAEIEFIEDFNGVWWLIDFNSRFPAWIFATAYTPCNLPQLLFAEASEKFKFHCSAGKIGENITPRTKEYQIGSHKAFQFSFARTIIEVPRVNLVLPRYPLVSGMVHGMSRNAKSEYVSMRTTVPHEILPEMTIKELQQHCTTAIDNLSHPRVNSIEMSLPKAENKTLSSIPMTLDLIRLLDETSKFVQTNRKFQSPKRLLCIDNVIASLTRTKDVVESAIKSARQGFSSQELEHQLCLSIKTQPNQNVLLEAKKLGYAAECISLAEAHAALNSGFLPNDIVLTGPGKFWDFEVSQNGVSNDLDLTEKIPRKIHSKLRAVFADSLSDLKMIVHRINDPDDWLDSEIIGIRWMPICGPTTRFGLDCNDRNIVEDASRLLKLLPENKKIGMHFHFASSSIGADSWIAAAKAFTFFCFNFGQIGKHKISAIDFGGGWSSYFLFDNQGIVETLVASIYENFSKLGQPLPCIQLEPGKSITESAGAILARVLGIREVSDIKSCNNEESVKCRALVIDTSCAEVSTPILHPIFWQASTINSNLTTQPKRWTTFHPGQDMIWGRTCMEFDILYSSIAIPDDLKEGDYVCLTNTGSYDFSNSYDFGDGASRNISII